ncbi:MAG: hypothetical protein KA163_03455 [Bacteroidia bacterium]|nr:hypothetical protein [Bacteroidia bacterium]
MKTKHFIIIVSVFVSLFSKAQTLSADELIYFPHQDPDTITQQLVAKGWEASNIEFITDSNFVRRTWAVKNKYDDLKSYLILYEYTSDTSENHIIYQFSSRQTFQGYKSDLKTKGYKLLVEKKNKKRSRKKDKDMVKEVDEAFYSDKKTSIINISEVFFYGMNTFMIHSYKTHSALGKNLLQDRP